MLRKVTLCFLLCALLLALLPAAPRAEAVTVAQRTDIYIEKNEAAGLSCRIYPVTNAKEQLMLYLPGTADPSQLRLSWDEKTSVTQNGTPLVSGEAPIPQPGASLVLQIGRHYFKLQTLQGSPEVEPLYLDIGQAEGYVSFQDMSGDETKAAKSAGTAAFAGAQYPMTLKGRGNSTWTAYEKKGYNITLYEDSTYAKKQSAQLIDGVSAKSWSLLANYTDGSQLRNKIGYDMAAALGIGLESRFVDLFVDGIYQGCYLMTPKNDYQAPKDGMMLEIDNYLDDEDPQFTLDGLNEYHPTRYGFQNRFTVKENKTSATTQDIQDYMQKAWDALRDHDSDDYLQYIDLDSWAKYYLLHEFYKSFDVICGSILMTRNGLTPEDKLMAGPIWDLDNTMGRTNNNVDLGLTPAQQHSPEGWYIQNIYDPEPWEGGDLVNEFWLQQLGMHESFRQRVVALYREYQAVFDGAAAQVEAHAAKLRASAEMNMDLIGFHAGSAVTEPDDHGCVVTEDWADCVENLQNYTEKRAAFLKNNISDLYAPPAPAPQPAEEFPWPALAAIAAAVVIAGGCVLLALKKRKRAE